MNEEMEEQQKIAVFFSKNKRTLKVQRHRLTNEEVENIVSDLMTMSQISKQEGIASCFGRIRVPLPLCIAYSKYYRKSIVVVHELRRTFVRFDGGESSDNDDTQICIALDTEKHTLRRLPVGFVLDGFIEMYDLRRPLRAISNYKVTDLNAMIAQLQLKEEKKRSKQELYSAIEYHCYGILQEDCAAAAAVV
jgi:hypothetical protein